MQDNRENQDFRSRVIKGLTWSVTSQVGSQLISFGITVILARLLSSSDFGLLAMAMVLIWLVQLVSEKGLTGALIQNQKIQEMHYSSAYWLNMFFGVMMALLLSMAAPYIAAFYGRPELKPIVTWLSWTIAIASLGATHRTYLSIKMNFKTLALVDAASMIVGGVVGITLAIRGYGVWSLVFQVVSFKATETLLLWFICPWKPKFIFSMDAIKAMFGFSASSSMALVVTFIEKNMHYVLIGKFIGAEGLGYYALATRLIALPYRNITQGINRVMFPAFSKIQDNLPQVRRVYLRYIQGVSFVAFPIFFGLFAVAPEFVHAIYGPKWLPAVDLIRILCVCGVIEVIGIGQSDIVHSQGRADIQLKLSVVGMLLSAVVISIGLRWGVYGVAILYTLKQILWIPVCMMVANSLIRLKMKTMISSLNGIFGISIIMMACVAGSKMVIHLSNYYSLPLLISIGMAVYLCLIWRINASSVSSRSFINNILTQTRWGNR